MSEFTIKSGDTGPSLLVTLYDGYPNPQNLTGTTVQMRMRAVGGGPLLIDAPAVIVGDPTLGNVEYQWQVGDTDEVGEFEVEWVVTFLGGAEQTFPPEGYTTVEVKPSLTSEFPLLPPLPTTCWPVDHGCCDEFDEYPLSVRSRADALAGQTLRMLTGYSVGGCPVLLRPCTRSCVGGATGWYYGGSTFQPHINTLGQWVNGCGCGSACGCTSLPTVHLGASVSRVIEVKVDGGHVPPSDYRLERGDRLVRLDGGTWPLTQDMALDDSEVGTFSVKVQYGAVVDGLGAYVAGVLACEFAKACAGKKCRLPVGVTNVTRQGVTMEMAAEAFPNGLTGIREVDAFIRRYNPHGLTRPSAVWSPDFITPNPQPVIDGGL